MDSKLFEAHQRAEYWKSAHEKLRVDLAASQAECERLRADAARINKLEEIATKVAVQITYPVHVRDGKLLIEGFRVSSAYGLGAIAPSLRAAIDAALAGKENI